MTKRLSAGVLLFAIAIFALAMPVSAERLSPKEWVNQSEDPYRTLPLFFRAAAGTTWVQVNSTGGCDPAEVATGGDIHDGLDHTSDQVWCFEGPDSLWPAGTGGTSQDNWSHWSRNLPPVPQGSRWHISPLDNNGGGNFFNAWCGCDSLGTNTACDDVAFWVNKKGYGDEWEQTLIADVSGLGAGSGGTVTFDLRYDTECVYDYLYLEYLNTGSGNWEIITDGGGTAAVFNGVSNGDGSLTFDNACDNGTGGAGDGNYFDTGSLVGGSAAYGNSSWYSGVSFPIPAQTGLQLRWRGSSDPAWSDQDGRGDTDGIGRIDNVVISFVNGDSFSDTFESGTFSFPVVVGGTASWGFGAGGNTYDGWHLEFDPMYKNKGNTCTFSDDWMWAAKPAGAAIPENGFEFFLTSPIIPTNGWTGGTCVFSQYQCMPAERNDYTNTHVRIYDTGVGAWSPWNDFDGFISFAGCEFWNTNAAEDLTPFLGSAIDSLQMGWEVLDIDAPGDFEWGKHGAVQYVVDNVTFGSFDGSSTVFTTRGIDIFADTFSRADPAHTPFLQNAEQGDWDGAGGGRAFANADSLEVAITDSDGMDPVGDPDASVNIFWRVEEGFGSGFGAWASKAMDFAVQDPTRPTGEGTYRAIIGADDGGSEDFDGTAANGLVWNAGTTVEYYILVSDNFANLAYFPNGADPVNATPTFFEFSVLPFNISTAGNIADGMDANGAPTDSQGPAGTHFVLLVDDYTRNSLDFENSTGFNPTGGIGQGAFDTAVFDQAEDMVERALALLYGGSEETPHWDKYDVQGGGSSVQCEPRGTSDVANGLGAYMTDNINPYYDAVIWLQGTFDEYSYADTTRLELASYLDAGGCLFSTGDQVAFHLGAAGNDADSTIGFLNEYFGTAFPVAADEMTVDRVLNVVGQGSMAGLELGVYGECPIRRTFDKLTLSTPVGATNSVLLTYEDGDPADNGRIAGIKNVRTVGGGTAAHLGFGIEALLNDVSRARVLGAFLGTDCGLTVNAVSGSNNGVDAPVIANGFGFNLAAARPNPFQDATSIQFAIPSKQHVTIEVFNILGQKVRTLVDENMDANSYVRDWDGRSDAGAEVSSGIYFYKMVAGQFQATKKAVLLK